MDRAMAAWVVRAAEMFVHLATRGLFEKAAVRMGAARTPADLQETFVEVGVEVEFLAYLMFRMLASITGIKLGVL